MKPFLKRGTKIKTKGSEPRYGYIVELYDKEHEIYNVRLPGGEAALGKSCFDVTPHSDEA